MNTFILYAFYGECQKSVAAKLARLLHSLAIYSKFYLEFAVATDYLDKFISIDWFCNVVAYTRPFTALDLLFKSMSSDRNNWGTFPLFLLKTSNLARGLIPVYEGKLKIHQNEIKVS